MTGSPAGQGWTVRTSEGVRRRQTRAPRSSRALAFVSSGDQAINDDQHHATPFGNSRGGSLAGFGVGSVCGCGGS
jgi:hypothetical protein